MKRDNQVITIFAILIVISAIYRVIPFENRPIWLGGPQLAIALFAGSIIKDRKWAFAIPIFSMLIGDLLMEGLFAVGATSYKGFYDGQLLNYALIAMLTVVGFFINHRKVSSIIGGMIAAPTLYFVISNFAVWVAGAGFQRPKTPAGLIQCYADALPFYGSSLLTMAVFGTLLFGSFSLITAGKAYKGIKAW